MGSITSIRRLCGDSITPRYPRHAFRGLGRVRGVYILYVALSSGGMEKGRMGSKDIGFMRRLYIDWYGKLRFAATCV